MALSWHFDDRPDHLLVIVDGRWHIQSVLKLIDEIGRRCRERNHLRVLIDMRQAAGPASESDRYLSGVRVASALGQIKVATVIAESEFETGFAARVAERRGGRLFVTKDTEEARQWLFEGD